MIMSAGPNFHIVSLEIFSWQLKQFRLVKVCLYSRLESFTHGLELSRLSPHVLLCHSAVISEYLMTISQFTNPRNVPSCHEPVIAKLLQ